MTRLRRITSPSKLHGCLICTKVARKLFQFNREVIKFQAEKTNTAPWPGAVQGKPTAPPAGPHTRNTGSLGPAGRQFGGPGGVPDHKAGIAVIGKKEKGPARAGRPASRAAAHSRGWSRACAGRSRGRGGGCPLPLSRRTRAGPPRPRGEGRQRQRQGLRQRRLSRRSRVSRRPRGGLGPQ